MRGGGVRIARDREEAAQNRLLLRTDARVGASRRLFEEPVGDFAGGSAADRHDAGDREQVFDQRLGARVVRALERRQHAGLRVRALAAADDGLQRTPLRKPAPHPAQPDIRQAEGAQHAIEHAGVADPHGQGTRAGRLGRFQREPENFRVRRLDVVASVAFEPGLDHLPALARARAKNRAEIGVLRLGARLRRGQDARGTRGSVYSGRRHSSAPEASLVR